MRNLCGQARATALSSVRCPNFPTPGRDLNCSPIALTDISGRRSGNNRCNSTASRSASKAIRATLRCSKPPADTGGTLASFFNGHGVRRRHWPNLDDALFFEQWLAKSPGLVEALCCPLRDHRRVVVGGFKDPIGVSGISGASQPIVRRVRDMLLALPVRWRRRSREGGPTRAPNDSEGCDYL